MADGRVDKELEQYRGLLETPTKFEDGFGWSTIAGIVFCGLIMTPGSIYLGLMTGGSLGGAASWVTVILFSEVMRRAMKTMSKGNLVVLLHGAGMLAGAGPISGFVWNAYLVSSDAARDMGMRNAFPTWFAPKPDSIAITERMLWHSDWLFPIGLAVFVALIGLLQRYTLGYFFFRLCSDVEQLPFPMAPISAQGTLALAESDKSAEELDQMEKVDKDGHKIYSKWRLFSLGTVAGLAFGFILVGVPAISGLIMDKPLFIIPQPWIELTPLTESLLPATPTGMVFDLGIILMGMVLPFWAVIGAFSAIVVTLVANPILQKYGVLSQWQPGMDTVNTTFVNGMDFWMSFGIGTAFAIAAISIYCTMRDVIRRAREVKSVKTEHKRAEVASLWHTPDLGRGDYPMWMALAGYCVCAVTVVALCNYLVPGILIFLIGFAFVYNPFISYVNARLLGLTGQSVDIPFVREGAFILSGCKSIHIWLAPIPVQNYGGLAQSFRVNELTGVNFRSLLKCDLVAIPFNFLTSFVFWAFIWSSAAIPSDFYPAAQKTWELNAKNQTLWYSATFVPEGADPKDYGFENTQLAKSLHPKTIAAGATMTFVLFTIFSAFGLPVMFIYGMIRGFGAIPHTMILEIVGALVGRYYFQRKFGSQNFLRMAPTICAGYATGVGLISMATVAMTLIKSAVSSLPF